MSVVFAIIVFVGLLERPSVTLGSFAKEFVFGEIGNTLTSMMQGSNNDLEDLMEEQIQAIADLSTEVFNVKTGVIDTYNVLEVIRKKVDDIKKAEITNPKAIESKLNGLEEKIKEQHSQLTTGIQEHRICHINDTSAIREGRVAPSAKGSNYIMQRIMEEQRQAMKGLSMNILNLEAGLAETRGVMELIGKEVDDIKKAETTNTEGLSKKMLTLEERHNETIGALEFIANEVYNITEAKTTNAEAISSKLNDLQEKMAEQHNNMITEIQDNLNRVRIPHRKEVQPCPHGWNEFQESCYFLSTYEVDWETGLKICEGMGAHYVTITSQEEWEFLSGLTNVQYWIGLNDRENEGVYVWSEEGTSPDFTKWGGTQPNDANGESDCVLSMGNHLWDDVYCGYSWVTIMCEKMADASLQN